MFKIIKRGHRKLSKSDGTDFGYVAPANRNSGSVSTSDVVVNHASIGPASTLVTSTGATIVVAPPSGTIEILPLFKDVPAPERQNLFLRKLQICYYQFDFSDNLKMVREKEIKRQTLAELVDFLQSGSGKITESNLEEMVRMISANIIRCLPPGSHENIGSEIIDPEDDEPYLEPSWIHLQLVYELLLRYIVSSETDTKIAKRYIDHSFVLKLLDLFDSEDPRERDYLKTILHRIYGKFMVHRPFIRKAINNIFYQFIYETERHSGIGELLEILGSIINGFALPMKEEHKLFLVRALIPLHKPKPVLMYQQQLSYCIIQFVEKDYKLADTVIRGLLKYWPVTNCQKEVLFLGELEDVLEATQPLFLNLGAKMVSNNQLFHLFLFLCFFQITCLHAQLCTQEQTSALLQFKQQFSFDKSASDYCYSVGIHSYPKMESWKEGSDCCSWDGVECDNNTSQVIGLDLSCSWLLGTIHPNSTIFYYFPHLQSLNLAFNDFGMSPISSEFSRFTRLTHLNLSESSFSGKVPIEVSFLSKLVSLDLSYNYGLRLEEPGFELLVQNLTKVRELNLRSVNISSVVSNSLLNLTSLTLLDLSGCGLRGKFPDGIFNLPHLNELLISYNLALTGYFPEFINSSSPLQYLRLISTNFSGELPDSIGNLKSLKTLYAHDCKFYGSIPTSLGNLTELTRLAISYNNFTGLLPSSLSNLGNLVKLGVQYNNFEGKIADFLPNAKSLSYLYVGSNNFSGPFPSLVANLTSLVELDLSNNQLTGPLPSWVFSLPVLCYFNLSNNKLTGHVKEFKSTDLVVIDLSNNSLYGRFPSSTFKLANLTSLILSSNNFSGQLDMLCHAVSLQLLVLSSNSFDGSIPQCFGNFSTYFSVLDLRKNNFSGTIPNTFVKGNSFEIINLNGNGFEGTVPKSLANCKMLRVVDLGCNKFSDKFPFWLEKLRWLQVLILRSNKFHGPMPASKAKFPFLNLRVMDLSDNYFTGPLPKTYFKNFNAMMNVIEANFKLQYIEKSLVGSTYLYPYHYHDSLIMVIKGSTIEMVKVLTIFTVIDLSKNNFEGQIPQIIGKLNSIRGLNLSHNSLTGHIPTSLANLTMLEWLDLSSNKLTGEIPRQLNNLKSLAVFNLSQNQLIGPTPQGNQFDTFLNDSYIGNLALCGPPLSDTCSDPTPPQQEDDTYSSSGFNWYVILSGYGCGLVWGIVMGYLMFSRGKPQWLVRIIEGERNESRKRFKKHAHINRGR